jgi:hypothetical protein
MCLLKHHFKNPIEKRMGGCQRWYRCSGEEKNYCPYQGSNLDYSACNMVIILTELSQLLSEYDM